MKRVHLIVLLLLAFTAMSLFHLFFPAIVIWMLVRQGYDPHAYWAQTALALVVLPLSFFIGTPEENINWVYGPLGAPQWITSPIAYLFVYMAFLPTVIFVPTHFLLKKVFNGPRTYEAQPRLGKTALG